MTLAVAKLQIVRAILPSEQDFTQEKHLRHRSRTELRSVTHPRETAPDCAPRRCPLRTVDGTASV